MKYSLLLLALVTFSCDKKDNDDDDQQTGNTKTQLLVNKKWQMTAASMQLSTGTIDAYSLFATHDKDDYIVFKTDMSYEWNANVLKLAGNPSDIVDKGTWKFLNNDQSIELKSTRNINYSEIKILELGDNNLYIEMLDPIQRSGNKVWIRYKPI